MNNDQLVALMAAIIFAPQQWSYYNNDIDDIRNAQDNSIKDAKILLEKSLGYRD